MSNSFAGFGTQRPNLTGDPELSDDERTVGRWFNTGAFTLAPRFTARVEVFNLTNAPPLGAPNGTFGSPRSAPSRPRAIPG